MSESLDLRREEGVRLLHAGDVDRALSEFNAAITQNPDDGKAYGLLGICHANKGDLAAAVDAMQQAARLQPNDAAAHFNLALALSKAERSEEAKREAEAALSLNPAHQGSRALLERLGGEFPGGAMGVPASFGAAVPSPFGASPAVGMPPSPFGASPAAGAPPSPFGGDPVAVSPPIGGMAPPAAGMGMDFGAHSYPEAGSEPTIGGAPGPIGMGAPGMSGPTMVQSPPGMSYTPPALEPLAREEAPGAGLRFGRGLLWGALWGQWWTLWTVIWMVVWQSGKHEIGYLAVEGILYLIGYAFFGCLLGVAIALMNADISTGAVIGVVIGLIACGVEIYLSGSMNMIVNAFFYFFTGRFIGASVARHVQRPVVKSTH